MKSYFLGVILAIVLSGVYVIQNSANVTINFIGFQVSISQGVWEVILFASGALIMLFFSVGASVESYMINKKKTQELNLKIDELTEEKKSLLSALQNIGAQPHGHEGTAITSRQLAAANSEASPHDSVTLDEKTTDSNAETAGDRQEAAKLPARKGFLASLFKKRGERAVCQEVGETFGTCACGSCGDGEPDGHVHDKPEKENLTV